MFLSRSAILFLWGSGRCTPFPICIFKDPILLIRRYWEATCKATPVAYQETFEISFFDSYTLHRAGKCVRPLLHAALLLSLFVAIPTLSTVVVAWW